ncbi:MAG TPA: CDP-diacylglycerol--serine O-phosphatidyltransferase, partial [Deltaproteobacteria bacterium]|nr:CDP-diacylglycerol--serine O-phosphatidyltransferase [Deltaproteobacteria bacterium]
MRRKRDATEKRKRAVPFLPNFITALSLFCGFYSIMFSLKGNYYMASIFILISGFIDGIDGRVARMTNSTSEFGKEFDSLSDLVAFGVAPAILVYLWELSSYGKFGFIASFLFVACGALRLARFNIDTSGGMTHFTGLPIPLAAAAVSSTYLLTGLTGSFPALTILVGVYVLSFLMVSSIQYPSFK